MANAPHWLMPTLWPQPEPEKVKVLLVFAPLRSSDCTPPDVMT